MVHYVGSKNNLDPLVLSETALNLDAEIMQILGESFLSKFTTAFDSYHFYHTTSLQYNEVYSYAKEVFQNNEVFEVNSVRIAKQLYESSTHPKVKGGEFYVCFYEGLLFEGRLYKAIGFFKTENKALFLDVQQQNNVLQLSMREGAELTKIDKGCLIMNTNMDEGYEVLIFDNQNRGEEALYWKEKFLGIQPVKNEFHQTNHFLSLTKQYITEQLESEFGTPKKDQIELLHKSIDYFKSKDSFNIEEFQQEVFQQNDMVESFRNFGSRYTEHHHFDLSSQFDISGQAVKKQMRIYKSVLKLDRNFHIYIHGNTELIEKGVDLDGRKYYKIYYQEES